MIRKALTELCNVSTDPEINSKNYLFGMEFIDNLFHVTNILKKHLTVDDITFLPSFKSQFICDEYQIPYTIDETNMKIIRFKSDLFLVNKELVLKIRTDLTESGHCSSTSYDDTTGIVTAYIK